MNATIIPESTDIGHMNQNRARHVAFWMNAAAKNGPTALPNPTQDPRMPWYLKYVNRIPSKHRSLPTFHDSQVSQHQTRSS